MHHRSTAVRLACASWLVAPTCGATVAQAADPQWVTGWEAPAHSAQGTYVGLKPVTPSYPEGFARQTLRLIVTPHAAGSRARIVLSNVFGARPVTFSSATVARRRRGATLVRQTLRRVTFDGRRSVTIAPGLQTVSDPVALPVAPFADLAVSLAFGAPTGPPTYHYNGLQTSYVTPTGTGDRTTSVSAAAFTGTTPMRFFLTAVHVRARRAARTVVAAGDSITDGGNYEPDTADRNTHWPDLLQRRLLSAGSRLSVANAGISANQVTHEAPAFLPAGGPSLERRFGRDVLSQRNLGGVLLAEGINDIGLSATPATTLVAGLTRLAHRAHAAHVPIVVAMLTPIRGAFYDSPQVQATRQQVNAWIRRQRVFDGVVDFAAAVQDPADPTRLRRAYDSGDHLHPNAEGFRAMARAIDLRAARRLFARSSSCRR